MEIGWRTCLFPRLDMLEIVVVDDHKAVRSALKVFLSGLGAVVHECSNAYHALEVIIRHQPALVVSDIAMPDKDGFELLQEIRSLDLSQKAAVICNNRTKQATRPNTSARCWV